MIYDVRDFLIWASNKVSLSPEEYQRMALLISSYLQDCENRKKDCPPDKWWGDLKK